MPKINEICLKLPDDTPVKPRVSPVPPLIPHNVYFYHRKLSTYTGWDNPLCHGNYIFMYVVSGVRTVKLNDVSFEVNAGQAILIAPYTRHEFCGKHREFTSVMASFQTDAQETRLLGVTGKVVKISRKDENILKMAVEAYLRRIDGNIAAAEETVILLSLFLRRFQTACGYTEQTIAIRDDEYPLLSRIVGYVSVNLDHRITLKELAKELHVSGSTIRQTFRKKMNCTIGHYQIQRRAIWASQLLKSTDLSVEEIARKVGFQSADGLRRVMKRETGLNARDTRNSWRQIFDKVSKKA